MQSTITNETDPRLWPKPPEPEIERIAVFEAGAIGKLQDAIRQTQNAIHELEIIRRDLARMLDKAARLAEVQPVRQVPRRIAPREAGKPTIMAKGPQRVLAALAHMHPQRVNAPLLASMCGFAPGTLRTYLPRLREAGLLDESEEGIGLSDDGCLHCRDHVPAVTPPPRRSFRRERF